MSLSYIFNLCCLWNFLSSVGAQRITSILYKATLRKNTIACGFERSFLLTIIFALHVIYNNNYYTQVFWKLDREKSKKLKSACQFFKLTSCKSYRFFSKNNFWYFCIDCLQDQQKRMKNTRVNILENWTFIIIRYQETFTQSTSIPYFWHLSVTTVTVLILSSGLVPPIDLVHKDLSYQTSMESKYIIIYFYHFWNIYIYTLR